MNFQRLQQRKSKEITEENKMFEQVREILSKYTKEEVKPTSSLKGDLGLSSFDVVGIATALEDEFDIEISDRDIIKIITVQDAIDYIEQA